MKTLMRYSIISGRTIEKRDVMVDISLDPETGKSKPRGKRRGKSLASQIERNRGEAILRLNRILNCNFGGGALLLTLKYSDDRLPEDRKAAGAEAQKLLRKLGAAYKRRTENKLRYVLVTADRSSKTGKEVRLHHHLVLDPVEWEEIADLWPGDQFSYRRLDDGGDYMAVAEYMIKNTGYRRGVRSWSTSQGLKKPEVTAPRPVKELGSFQVPTGAVIRERQIKENQEDGFRAAYIRYTVPKEKVDDSTHGKCGKIREGKWQSGTPRPKRDAPATVRQK